MNQIKAFLIAQGLSAAWYGARKLWAFVIGRKQLEGYEREYMIECNLHKSEKDELARILCIDVDIIDVYMEERGYKYDYDDKMWIKF
jgi:hypothetical protein